MKKNWRLCFLWLFPAVLYGWLLAGSAAILAQGTAGPSAGQNVKATLVANTKAVRAATPFKLGVELTMAPGWHTYYKESGDAGMPTQINWDLPEGFRAGPLEWQKPERFDETGIVTYGYENHVLIGATIEPPAELPAGGTLSFKAAVKWLGCKDICVPGRAEVSLSLPVSGAAPEADNQDSFAALGFQGSLPSGVAAEAAEAPTGPASKGTGILEKQLKVQGAQEKPLGLLAYLALAFVGGFILNFMPCVLPVISLKLLGIVEQAGEAPGRVFKLGLAFASGILASCLVLAMLVVSIQMAGEKVGWGFQFQNPGFVLFMSVVVLLLALSMFGVFYVSFPGAGQAGVDKLASKEGYGGSFFNGVLATILATPCSAPFLGTAVGFAFTQPAWIIALMFLTIGLGMAFPYILLTANPAWMRFIPKPGNWMNTFKEMMGFLLLATVIWLLWVLGGEVGLSGVLSTSAFLLMVGFAAWLVGHMTDLTSSARRVYSVWTLAVGTVLLGYYMFIRPVPGLGMGEAQAMVQGSGFSEGGGQEQGGIVWQPFTIEALDQQLASGKTVFIDFTAEWCLTCKVNERTAINTRAVAEKMRQLNVVPLKADWTRQNPVITQLLQKFGRSGVPLYVIFPSGRPDEPIVLPEVVTQALVLEKLDEAGGG